MLSKDTFYTLTRKFFSVGERVKPSPTLEGEHHAVSAILKTKFGPADLREGPIHADGIVTEWLCGETHTPTAEHLGATQRLRGQLFHIGQNLGVVFKRISIFMEDRNFAVTPHENGGFELKVGLPEIEELSRSGKSVEGVLRHEAGHALYNHFKFNKSRHSTIDSLDLLSDISASIKSDPSFTAQVIRGHFGTVAKFAKELKQFESQAQSLLHLLKRNPEIQNAAPEAIARWMETDDAKYRLMMEYAKDPAARKTVEKFAQNLFNTHSSMQDTILSRRQFFDLEATPLDALHLKLIQPRIRRLTTPEHKRLLKSFSSAFARGEEYAVDRIGTETAQDKSNLSNRFQDALATEITEKQQVHAAQWGDVPFHAVGSDKDSDTHPSTPRRLLRMAGIRDGKLPDDETLRNFSPFTKVASVAMGHSISVYPARYQSIPTERTR